MQYSLCHRTSQLTCGDDSMLPVHQGSITVQEEGLKKTDAWSMCLYR